MDKEMPVEETSSSAAAKPAMPKGPSFPSMPAAADPATTRPTDSLPETRRDVALAVQSSDDRAGVFRHLVTDDGDIAGLVAYSIYKQNKLDWLNAFSAQRGRAPKDDELISYIIGEGTPRRLATYRHLAEATLAGHGPAVGGDPHEGRAAFRRVGGFGDRGALTTGLLVTYALIAVLFIVGFLLAAHYTMSSR